MVAVGLSETPVELADLDGFEVTDSDGNVIAMFGLSCRLFFTQGETTTKRLAAIDALARYAERFAGRLTHAAFHDGSLLRLADGDPFPRFRAEAPLNDLDAESFYCAVIGFSDKAPDYRPHLFEARVSAEMPAQARWHAFSEFAASFSIKALLEHGAQDALDVMRDYAALVRPRHGVLGPCLLFDQSYSHRREDEAVFGLLRRFPGLDFDDGGGWITHAVLNQKMRSISWLTQIDTAFVEELGGRDHLVTAAGDAVTIHDYEGGVILQAGDMPKTGDVNRGWTPEPYKTVARMLKPIRFENYTFGLLHAPKPLDSLDETLKWVRRFD